jgi:hypothetical protein
MAEYFADGKHVSRKRCIAVWLASQTYRRAKESTRDRIWRDAEAGIDRDGALNHLREAGIRIVIDHQQNAAQGGGENNG